MADVNRFAGFTSPLRLVHDPFLPHDEKLSGLFTWRGRVERLQEGLDPETEAELVREINRALARLRNS